MCQMATSDTTMNLWHNSIRHMIATNELLTSELLNQINQTFVSFFHYIALF